jgi:hypothetical protein
MQLFLLGQNGRHFHFQFGLGHIQPADLHPGGSGKIIFVKRKSILVVGMN